MKDRIFEAPAITPVGRFAFTKEVADVFDDMLARSIPAYDSLQYLLSELAVRLTPPDGKIFDLGCSTGNTLAAIAKRAADRRNLIGIDSAPAMIEHCRTKLRERTSVHDVTLLCADLSTLEELPGGPADVTILCLVAQFFRPLDRQRLLELVHRNLRPGGALLFVEKTIQTDRLANSVFIDIYHAFNADNGYSQTEIARKREALENVLVPFLPEENIELLAKAGFVSTTIFYSMVSFQGYLALKAAS